MKAKVKEKAIEIVDKFLLLQETIEWGNEVLKEETGLIYIKNEYDYNKYYFNLAKASGLLAVDLVLSTDLYSMDSDFWINVYEEIEKL